MSNIITQLDKLHISMNMMTIGVSIAYEVRFVLSGGLKLGRRT